MMAMQSAPGSLYHCPGGSDIYPKDGTEAENVSNENNFSVRPAADSLHTPS